MIIILGGGRAGGGADDEVDAVVLVVGFLETFFLGAIIEKQYIFNFGRFG